jgi:hypothetical protein
MNTNLQHLVPNHAYDERTTSNKIDIVAQVVVRKSCYPPHPGSNPTL